MWFNHRSGSGEFSDERNEHVTLIDRERLNMSETTATAEAPKLTHNEAIKTAVEEGIGIAVITRRVVSKELTMGTLRAIPLSDPSMTRKFYLIHHKDKYFSRPFQSLIDMVDQWVADYRREEHEADFIEWHSTRVTSPLKPP